MLAGRVGCVVPVVGVRLRVCAVGCKVRCVVLVVRVRLRACCVGSWLLRLGVGSWLLGLGSWL